MGAPDGDQHLITTTEQLRALLGEPKPGVAEKERPALDELDRMFIAASPMCLIATSDEHGRCDVSPRGDPPGSFLVLDDTTVALGDRPGNRRADSLRNLLTNPQIGLLFLVPGRGDTLRLNGRAQLVTDPALLDRLVVQGHRPKLAVRVAVEEVFFHCAKAFLRSKLWEAGTWDPDVVPPRAQIAKRQDRQDEPIEALEEYYGPSYAERIYVEHP